MRTEESRQVSQKTSHDEVRMKPEGRPEKADVRIASRTDESPMFGKQVMEEICEKENLKWALKRVRQNRGSPGVDGMNVDDLGPYLKDYWLEIREELLTGRYQPRPIKRVEIPKPGQGNKKRKLGIPCVLDRFIQQAMLQVLQRQWDDHFSDHSYGFRPGRSAHQAISTAQSYLKSGYSMVVDIDLESFFDRVNHDRLMSRLAQQIEDKRVLKLIRAYLTAGIMAEGLVQTPTEGTPQGGPLSPFLSNVVLDELDKELERRGHHFVRYADDCNIYVKSQKAGERVKASISRYITQKLKLKVNEAKSAVDYPHKRKFLGYTFASGNAEHKRKIAGESLKRFRARVRQLTRRTRGISLEERIERLSRYLSGWKGYFGFCQTPSVLRDLDSWIRRRLRSALWKQWKVYRTRKAKLIQLGLSQKLAHTTAWSAKGPWRLSHSPGVQMALSNDYFKSQGLICLAG